MIACCDASFIFLFFVQQQRRSLPRTLSVAKWKGRTLHRPVHWASFRRADAESLLIPFKFLIRKVLVPKYLLKIFVIDAVRVLIFSIFAAR